MPNQYSVTFLLLSSLVACAGEVARIGAGTDSGAGSAGQTGTSTVVGGSSSGGLSCKPPLDQTFPSCPYNSELVLPADKIPLSDIALSDEECEITDQALLGEWEATDARKEFDVAPLAGTWIDESGNERVEVVLDATANGSYLIGNEDRFPEIVDPHAPFLTSQGPTDAGIAPDHGGVRRNFRYRVYPVTGLGSQMSFSLRASQPWDAWCALQTPVRGDRCYGCELDLDTFLTHHESVCGPNAGCYTVSYEGLVAQVHCGRASLCRGPGPGLAPVCACTSEECRGTAIDDRQPQLTVTRDPVDPTVLRLDDGNGSDTRYLVRAD